MEANTLDVVKNTFAEIINEYESLEARALNINNMLITINAQQKQEIEQRARVSQRLETLLEILPGGVIVLDQNGIVVQSNFAAANILGIDKLVNKKWASIIASICTPKLDDGLEVSLHNGKLISVATNPLPGEIGQIILITDLTKTRELQAQINQQKKLTAMGEMISSLAHQIKTPLASALIYISHVCNNSINHQRKELYAGRVKERLLHLDNLLQSMLMYVKGYIPASGTIYVDDLLRSLTTSISEIVSENKMHVIVCNTVGKKSFVGNLAAFVSALINLIINSMQASAAGSHICVIVKMYDAEYIDIIVSDKGAGISEENLPKVFQAFFSTKATGTGLGLSVVETVATSCNGRVWLESSRELGTKVGIRVPGSNIPALAT